MKQKTIERAIRLLVKVVNNLEKRITKLEKKKK